MQVKQAPQPLPEMVMEAMPAASGNDGSSFLQSSTSEIIFVQPPPAVVMCVPESATRPNATKTTENLENHKSIYLELTRLLSIEDAPMLRFMKCDKRRNPSTGRDNIVYTCLVCDTEHRKMINFVSHVRAHSNTRPYCCCNCGKSFT